MNTNHGQDGWGPCQPGLIQDVAGRPLAKKIFFSSAVAIVLIASSAAVGAGFIGWTTLIQSGIQSSVQMPEKECLRIQQYISSLVKNEIDCCRIRSEVCNHVTACGECHEYYRELKKTIGCCGKKVKPEVSNISGQPRN
ncbi:MAG: hypothetical protein AAF623_03590 [Planctomycetota bacterium]